MQSNAKIKGRCGHRPLREKENKMENLILRPDNTPEAQQAMALHYEIRSSLAAAANAMVDFCRQLKVMRDGKQYIHIGFDTFEDYVEKAHNIHQRQRYVYIQTYEKLGPQLISENAGAGITNLQLLTKVSAVHRDELLEENDLANITVAELEKLIEEKKGLSEQVSFFRNASKDKEEIVAERDKLLRQVKQLNEELEEKDRVMFTTPVETASIDSELVDKIRAEAKAEAETRHLRRIKELNGEYERRLSDAVKKEKEKAGKKLEKERADFEKEKQAAAEQAVKEARDKLVAEFEEENKYILQQLNEQKEKAAALQKQIELNGNKDTVKFSILFSSVQDTIAELEDLIDTISETDRETAAKFNNALQRLFRSKVGE